MALENLTRISRRTFVGGAVAATAGAAAIALTGCGDDDDQGGTSKAPGTTEAKPSATPAFDLNATLRLGIANDAASYDAQSLQGYSGAAYANLAPHFHSPLTFDPASNAVVGLAADWSWADSNAAMVLKVKPGVKFHNGEVLDAEGLKFNLDRVMERNGANKAEFKSGPKGSLSALGEATVIDATTVRIALARPDVNLPYTLFRLLRLAPKGYISSASNAEVAAKGIGNGPFKMVSRTPDSEVRSERFDEFINSRDSKIGPRASLVKTLVQRVIPDAQARVASLEAGEIDFAYLVTADQAKSFDSRSGYRVFYAPTTTQWILKPNTVPETNPLGGGANPWRDARVRKAANLAIDMDTIIKTVLTGKEKFSLGAARGTFGVPSSLDAKRWKFDPTQAKTLLAQAGFQSGFQTVLNYSTPGIDPQVAQAVAAMLGAVGIRAEAKVPAAGSFQPTILDKSIPGLVALPASELALDARLFYHSTAPYSLTTDKSLDPLVEQYEKEFDNDKRRTIAEQVLTKNYEDANWVFLYEPVNPSVAKSNVEWTYYNPTALVYPEYWNIGIRAKA